MARCAGVHSGPHESVPGEAAGGLHRPLQPSVQCAIVSMSHLFRISGNPHGELDLRLLLEEHLTKTNLILTKIGLD